MKGCFRRYRGSVPGIRPASVLTRARHRRPPRPGAGSVAQDQPEIRSSGGEAGRRRRSRADRTATCLRRASPTSRSPASVASPQRVARSDETTSTPSSLPPLPGSSGSTAADALSASPACRRGRFRRESHSTRSDVSGTGSSSRRCSVRALPCTRSTAAVARESCSREGRGSKAGSPSRRGRSGASPSG
jgi:hypothetical protein